MTHTHRIAGLLLAGLLLSGGTASADYLPRYFDGPPPWGTGQSRGEDLKILLVTFGPGPVEDVASWFGHTALVVEDTRLRHSRLYNYGMFSFDSTMLARFAMGRLEFWVEDAPYAGTLRFYRSLDRDVRIQELNLDPDARLKTAHALADNVLAENREYLYHHYDDNCSTRPRDVIDQAVGGQLRASMSGPARMTLRDHTRRHSAVMPPMSVLLDFLMNDEIDRPIQRWDEAFLPAELERQIEDLRYRKPDGTEVPLVARQWTFYASTKAPVPETPPSYAGWLLLIGGVLGGAPLLVAWRTELGSRVRRWVLGLHSAFVGLVFGVPGTVLFIMWMFTEHTVTWRNENLFLANPLTLALIPLGFSFVRGKSPRAPQRLTRWWWGLAGVGGFGVCLKVLPPFDQDNWRLIALMLPVSCMAAAAFFLDERARTQENAADGGYTRANRRLEGADGSAPGASLTSTASGRESR